VEGLVVKSTGSWYEIMSDSGNRIQARLKGKFRIKGLKSTNPVSVGDRVAFEMEGDEGVIFKIAERKNYIIRKSINLSKQVQIIAANVDQLFLMITLKNPKTFMGFVDRFLVGAEAYRIPVVLLYNKMDLLKSEVEKEEVENWKLTYDLAGYHQIELSVKDGRGIEKVRELMKNKVSIFSGHSGVGKSSLINALDPKLDLRVNQISASHQSGKHTTTFAELFELDFGAKIIDTPGIKGYGNVELEKAHLAHYFPEMRLRMNDCKFADCAHINEPKCAIKEAMVEGEIAESRYFNYLSMYEQDENETYRPKGY